MNLPSRLLIATLLLPLACGNPTGNPTSPVVTLAVLSTSLRDGVRSVTYSDTLTATGGDSDYTWSIPVGVLPTGLTLNTSTGEISGTPTTAETRNFTVQVASGDGQSTRQALSIRVSGTAILQPRDLCSEGASPTDIATFEDGNLVAAVRSTLGLGATDDLTCGLLSGLTNFSAPSAGIMSLVGIQNLTGLITLELAGNSITDISALSGLTNLMNLDLSDNLLTDIQPLLDNPGLGAGDTVDLSIMVLSCTDIATLKARLVTVISNCS